MSTKNRYDEDFKRTLVELYHNGKTQTALTKWIKLYSTIQTESGEVFSAKQIKDLQKRMAQL